MRTHSAYKRFHIIFGSWTTYPYYALHVDGMLHNRRSAWVSINEQYYGMALYVFLWSLQQSIEDFRQYVHLCRNIKECLYSL